MVDKKPAADAVYGPYKPESSAKLQKDFAAAAGKPPDRPPPDRPPSGGRAGAAVRPSDPRPPRGNAVALQKPTAPPVDAVSTKSISTAKELQERRAKELAGQAPRPKPPRNGGAQVDRAAQETNRARIGELERDLGAAKGRFTRDFSRASKGR